MNKMEKQWDAATKKWKSWIAKIGKRKPANLLQLNFIVFLKFKKTIKIKKKI